jgi:pimeloyl-ACP methyl ester carboxylesterase
MPHPFEQLLFDQVPEVPRVPHAFSRTYPRDVEVDSRGFGRLRIHYRELGSGPPLLLIHGLMTSSYSWRYVYEPLAKHFRVIAPDLPGCGRSAYPVERSFSPTELAAWIGELQVALGIQGCACIGNSMGGYLCMRLALEQPRAFRVLVNIHSPGVSDWRFRALKTAFSLPGSSWMLRRLVQHHPLKWAHRNVHYHDETLKSLEEAREYAAPFSSVEGVGCFGRYLSETLSPNEMDAFVSLLQLRCEAKQEFPVPLMLLYARQDPMVPPSVGHRLSALIPDARMVWLENTSHFAHVDTPQKVLDAVLPFLSAPLPR